MHEERQEPPSRRREQFVDYSLSMHDARPEVIAVHGCRDLQSYCMMANNNLMRGLELSYEDCLSQ